MDRGPAHHKRGSRTLLWSGLPAWLDAPGTARPGHRGSERPGNAIDRRWRADLRNSLARCVPAGPEGTPRGRRAGDGCAEGHGGADPAAYGASASNGSEMEFV